MQLIIYILLTSKICLDMKSGMQKKEKGILYFYVFDIIIKLSK